MPKFVHKKANDEQSTLPSLSWFAAQAAANDYSNTVAVAA
jgi:hypothetical protein